MLRREISPKRRSWLIREVPVTAGMSLRSWYWPIRWCSAISKRCWAAFSPAASCGPFSGAKPHVARVGNSSDAMSGGVRRERIVGTGLGFSLASQFFEKGV